MRKDLLLAIVVTLVAMAGFYLYDKKNPSEAASPTEKRSAVMVGSQQSDEQLSAAAKLTSKDNTLQTTITPQTSEDIAKVQQNFSAHLHEIARCLEIRTAVDSERVDPTFDNLIVSLRPALGELVVQMEDWTQTDVQAANGELRRIRTEVSYEDTSNAPTKRVQYYKINQDNMPEMQPLDAEKSLNPDDAFLDNLKGGGRTLLEEKAGRAYYQEGEELVIIERNGKIESISLTHGPKTFSCSNLDTLRSSCQCQ